MTGKQIGFIRRHGVPDREVNWDKVTGQVYVRYLTNSEGWKWRTSSAMAKTIGEAFNVAVAILEAEPACRPDVQFLCRNSFELPALGSHETKNSIRRV